MTVFVLLEMNSYTDYEFCGVFATRAQAQKRFDEIVEEIPRQRDSLYIEEYIIDWWGKEG